MVQVDVVVPTKDRPQLLRRTVDTLLSQRGVDVRIVVVDDGSSVPAQQGLAAGSRVRHVRHEQSRGAAAARDTGATAGEADWVAFCDDDDLWAPDKLRRQLDAMQADPRAQWSFTSAVVVDEHLQPLRVERVEPDHDVAPLLLERNIVPGGASSVLITRRLFNEAGGFSSPRPDGRPLRHAEDYSAWCRFGHHAHAAPVDLPLVAYLAHRGGKSRGPAMGEDIDRVRADWQAERDRHGLKVDDRWRHHYVAQMHLRSGRRLAGALEHGRWGVQHREPAALLRAAVALVYPQAQHRADRRTLRRTDPQWLALAEDWLAPLRRASSSAAPAA